MIARLSLAWLVALPLIAHADKDFTQPPRFRGRAPITWNCAVDPVVKIDHAAATYALKGTCKRVSVNSAGGKLAIERAEVLEITGARNVISIGAVGEIRLAGAHNTITWASAPAGEPRIVATSGTGNRVIRKQ